MTETIDAAEFRRLHAAGQTRRGQRRGRGRDRFRADERDPDYQGQIVAQCRLHKLPQPVPEHRFDEARGWRLDLAWTPHLVAVEIEGGTWMKTGSRHTRGAGFEEDCLKYGEAVLLGWRLLRVTGRMVEDGRALSLIERALRAFPPTERKD